jgi:XTP/dITP diphosphohydrolase
MRLLIATNNAHKVKEIRAILAPFGLPLLTPADIGGLPELPETGATFAENAAQKAMAAAAIAAGRGLADILAFADDSGIEVAALGHAPGVHSARYAPTDAERISRLLGALGDHPDRCARFVCVIALASPDRLVATFPGEVRGTIADGARGVGGFGYDPIFIPEGHGQTFAELGAEIKDTISHRARALDAFRRFLAESANHAVAPSA